MRLLFVKDRLAFPRSSGHDVHGFYLMQALAHLGHEVSLATLGPVDPRAVAGGGFASLHTFDGEAKNPPPIQFSKLQAKFANYWGVPTSQIQRIGEIAEELQADAVAVVGLHVLPYLGAVRKAKRVWYAGDEWVWHHLSLVSWKQKSTWGELKQSLIKGLYEHAFAGMLDRVWMVSESDRKAYRWVTGCRNVDVLANGIDAEHYRPSKCAKFPKSCVFWGRLDFGPNVQALEWFAREVWPRVIQREPDAKFDVFGFQLTPEVQRLIHSMKNASVTPDLPDLREEVQRREIVVLPFVSGGGIKNKLLEAAAMGQAIVCTPRTVTGLKPRGSLLRAESGRDFAEQILKLFASPGSREQLGAKAREWVMQSHTWTAAARVALNGLLS